MYRFSTNEINPIPYFYPAKYIVVFARLVNDIITRLSEVTSDNTGIAKQIRYEI
ncbi:MAG: hypothetical protein J7K40_07650 [candidate division Zixibacteria bacterium]|nr:hypothetical protein [candidate division Zixibacteria bacterium]